MLQHTVHRSKRSSRLINTSIPMSFRVNKRKSSLSACFLTMFRNFDLISISLDVTYAILIGFQSDLNKIIHRVDVNNTIKKKKIFISNLLRKINFRQFHQNLINTKLVGLNMKCFLTIQKINLLFKIIFFLIYNQVHSINKYLKRSSTF